MHMRELCVDMVSRLECLAHIDMARVAVAFAQTRKPTHYGMFASLTPLRFEGGAEHTQRRGRRFTVQRLFADDGREMLYILTFYLPRFMDLPFREKLITVLHELWHISPAFNGDLRRHPGRCFAHSHSQKEYDEQMGRFADAWLATGPEPRRFAFLQTGFADLAKNHGRVFGLRIRRPRLIPLD